MFPQDFLGITPHVDQQLFFTGSATWQTWHKPEGKCLAWMMCIGGAGGGAGGGGAANNIGAGGGSGGIARLFIPLWHLPETLYIQIGAGGAGGGAGVSGTNGASSYISLAPNATAANCYLASGHTAATGGKITPSAGVGEVVSTVADCILASLGNFIAIVGVNGSNAGGGITSLQSIPLTGGAGGGTTNGAGANLVGAGLLPTITGGGAGGAGAAGNGRDGVNIFGAGRFGFMSNGGSGGGGASTGTSGNGGNGGLGSGGAGGGTANGGTGGAGGKGGDGLIAIWCA